MLQWGRIRFQTLAGFMLESCPLEEILSGARQTWGKLTKGEYVRSPWKQTVLHEREGSLFRRVDFLDPRLHHSGREEAQWAWLFVTLGEEWRPEADKEAQTTDSVEKKSATGP